MRKFTRRWRAHWFVHRALKLLLPTKVCANRAEYDLEGFKNHAVHIIVYDLRGPTAYSREEVYSMLRTVREEERRMDWKCPEPD
jgi:hypothetical protein